MISKNSKLCCTQPWAQPQNLHIWPVLREHAAGVGTGCGRVPARSAAQGGVRGTGQECSGTQLSACSLSILRTPEKAGRSLVLRGPFQRRHVGGLPPARLNSLRISSQQCVGTPGRPRGARYPERPGADSPRRTRHPVPPHKWAPGHRPCPPQLSISPSCC